MKTLCKEGKKGCVRAEILLSFFFLFFNALYSQTPVNGFCIVSGLTGSAEYGNMLLSDINFDEKEDVILYDKSSNSFLLAVSVVRKGFQKPVKKFFYFPVSKIEEIKKETASRSFLFLSRKEKLIGLTSISKNEKIRLLDVISYKSIPSNFSVKKKSSGKITEALIYGEPFEGISLLKIKDSEIYEKRILPDNVFKSAAWIDLNYDGIDDIAAYDIFDGELMFLLNDGTDNYKFERRIRLENRLQELKSLDWNGDGYNDLFFFNAEGFEILLGDSVSSFKNRAIFRTGATPSKYALSDFNADGTPDIAWLEDNSDGVYFLFSESDSSFSEPQKYFHEKTFVDIKKSTVKNGSSLYLLSNDGKILKIDDVPEKMDTNMFLTAGAPSLASGFKTNRYNDLSLAYFDSLSGSVNLLISELEVFNKEFRFPTAKNHTEFKAFFTSDSIRTFLLYGKGEKLIEVFRFNIYDYSVNSFEIYSGGNLRDVTTIGDNLLALTLENGSAEIENYLLKGNKFIPKKKPFEEANVFDAALSLGKNASVYFLTENNDTLFLHKRKILPDKSVEKITPLGKSKSFDKRVFLFRSRKGVYPAVVNNDGRLIEIVLKNKIKKVPLQERIAFPLKNVKSFYFMGFNYLFVQSEGTKGLTELQLDLRMDLLGAKKFIESEEVIDYFGAELMKFPYLFYINKHNELKLKKI